jgi:hypothetical protein
VSTGWDNPKVLERVPIGVEIVLEAVPEPGNPQDGTAIALDLYGGRVGYLYRFQSGSLFPWIVEANKAGFHVLMRGQVTGTDGVRELRVRAADAVDLQAWLRLPPSTRGTKFFGHGWIKDSYQGFYQDQLSALLTETTGLQLYECDFVAGGRRDFPYGTGPGAPQCPDEGTYADIFVAGVHVGELRGETDGLHRIYRGQRSGLARFEKWPNNIELKVHVPLG